MTIPTKLTLVSMLTAGLLSGCVNKGIEVKEQQISEGHRYQAIDIDEEGRIWVSGTNSGVAVSKDNGATWQNLISPASEGNLQYRDISVQSDNLVLMAAGEGSDSRVYFSNNLGEHWQLQSQGSQKTHFYNCISTLPSGDIWLFGDSQQNELFVMNKSANSSIWQQYSMPVEAKAHEGGFASSGTCLNHNSAGDLVIGTGNTEQPRVMLKLKDQDWQIVDAPLAGGEAAGIFSMQFDQNALYAFGGSLKKKEQPAVAFRYDLQSSQWQPLPELPIKGAVYGSAVTGKYILVSNPKGVAVLSKGSTQWQLISNKDIWALECASDSVCWGVGADDTVIKITLN
jgi:hypothetical protein